MLIWTWNVSDIAMVEKHLILVGDSKTQSGNQHDHKPVNSV
jgi:hypothetical protein